MPVATALIAGNEPLPQLAEQAVRAALARAGATQANAVLLFLTADFARHVAPAITAAGRAARSLQVFGGLAAGVCTEAGWIVDRPAAAAMVLLGATTLAPADAGGTQPRFCLSSTALPQAWTNDIPRFGMHFQTTALPPGSGIWHSGRPGGAMAEVSIVGTTTRIALSAGLRLMGDYHAVQAASGYELHRIANGTALAALQQALPEAWRDRQPLPLHLINAIREGDEQSGIALLSANADGSLTLAAPVTPGERIGWAIRDAEAVAEDMRASLAATGSSLPDFALFHSCIGRGPYFYGGEDRDLAILRESYPGLPLIGGYGTGQIAPLGNTNRQWQNCVVTALFNETAHVQPQP